MEKVTVHLGQEVEDIVTGYKGIVTSITDFLYGCRRVGVIRRIPESERLDENSIKEALFDEPGLKIISNGLYIAKNKPIRTGGSRDVSTGRVLHNRR